MGGVLFDVGMQAKKASIDDRYAPRTYGTGQKKRRKERRVTVAKRGKTSALHSIKLSLPCLSECTLPTRKRERERKAFRKKRDRSSHSARDLQNTHVKDKKKARNKKKKKGRGLQMRGRERRRKKRGGRREEREPLRCWRCVSQARRIRRLSLPQKRERRSKAEEEKRKKETTEHLAT